MLLPTVSAWHRALVEARRVAQSACCPVLLMPERISGAGCTRRGSGTRTLPPRYVGRTGRQIDRTVTNTGAPDSILTGTRWMVRSAGLYNREGRL
jgi:hypothetical protein